MLEGEVVTTTGFKALRIDSTGCIHSLYAKHLWTAEGNRAVCQVPSGELMRSETRKWDAQTPCPEPPDPSCCCGFYAYPTAQLAGQSPATQWEHLCLALVQLYGRVIEHEDGVLRSEWMHILALVGIPFQDWYDVEYEPRPVPRSARYAELLQKAAEMLSVPYATKENLTLATLWLNEQRALQTGSDSPMEKR